MMSCNTCDDKSYDNCHYDNPFNLVDFLDDVVNFFVVVKVTFAVHNRRQPFCPEQRMHDV